MSTQDRFFHRIVAARRTGTVQRGHISLKQPMSIGTGSTADLRLEASGATILSIHAHVLVTETSEVQIVNLGSLGSMSLNGRPLYTAHPTTWVPGELVSIGDYELRLDAIDRTTATYAKRQTTQTGALREPKEPGDNTRIAPAVKLPQTSPSLLAEQVSTGEVDLIDDDEPTQPQPSVLPPTPHEMTFWADSSTVAADISDGETPYEPLIPISTAGSRSSAVQVADPVNPDNDATPFQPMAPPKPATVPVPSFAASHTALPDSDTAPFATAGITADNDATPYKPLQLVNYVTPPSELPETLDSEQTALYDPHKHPTRESEGSALVPGDEIGQINSISPAMPAPMVAMSQFTQPKNWMYTGKLSAQLTMNPVNLAPGEQIYVPISIRNEYSHSVELHVTVAGVPHEWITLPLSRLTLAPNEIQTLDLIIQTPSSVSHTAIDAVVGLSDVMTPQIALNVPLSIAFKHTPDIVGWLDPAEISDSGPAYLYLQNHTQALVRVFVTGHCSTNGVHVLTNADWVDIPPGQIAKVPITVDIRQRPRLRGMQCQFWVTAQQGSRAPLAYAGVVRVRSGIGG